MKSSAALRWRDPSSLVRVASQILLESSLPESVVGVDFSRLGDPILRPRVASQISLECFLLKFMKIVAARLRDPVSLSRVASQILCGHAVLVSAKGATDPVSLARVASQI